MPVFKVNVRETGVREKEVRVDAASTAEAFKLAEEPDNWLAVPVDDDLEWEELEYVALDAEREVD